MLDIFKFLFNRSKNKNELRKKEFKEKISYLESALNKKDETLASLYETLDKKNDDLVKHLEVMRFLAFDLEEKNKELNGKKEKLEFIADVINSQPVKNSSY